MEKIFIKTSIMSKRERGFMCVNTNCVEIIPSTGRYFIGINEKGRWTGDIFCDGDCLAVVSGEEDAEFIFDKRLEEINFDNLVQHP